MTTSNLEELGEATFLESKVNTLKILKKLPLKKSNSKKQDFDYNIKLKI